MSEPRQNINRFRRSGKGSVKEMLEAAFDLAHSERAKLWLSIALSNSCADDASAMLNYTELSAYAADDPFAAFAAHVKRRHVEHEAARLLSLGVKKESLLAGDSLGPGVLLDLVYPRIREQARKICGILSLTASEGAPKEVSIPCRVIAAVRRQQKSVRATTHFLDTDVLPGEPTLSRYQVYNALAAYERETRRWLEESSRYPAGIALTWRDMLELRCEMDFGVLRAALRIRKRMAEDSASQMHFVRPRGEELIASLDKKGSAIMDIYRAANEADAEAGEPWLTMTCLLSASLLPPDGAVVRYAA